MSDDRVYVVSAAIINADAKRVLLAQRVPTTSYPWHWCTPGGKVELGESHADALFRELKEELGVAFDGSLGRVVYQRDVVSTRTGKTTTVVCYVIDWRSVYGVYTCGDGTIGLGWFGPEDLQHITLTPADAAEREALIAATLDV